MNKERDVLLQKAIRRYALKYGRTPENSGLNYAAIWYKPIMKRSLQIYKLPEVVFGETEKEVCLFIKTQKILRWGINLFIFLMLFGATIFLILPFLLEYGRTTIFWSVMVVSAVVCLGYLIIGTYITHLQKQINNDRIVTFMDF